ncbi:hypothetical protein MMC25_001480 [Agyrium rufum]|nr:hypothetical protein [Agyrium rufum]
MSYHVADASSYVVVTGGGVKDVKIVKKAWVQPWQKCAVISISPFDFEITLQAMTMEKLQFCLPAVFTIGPDDSPIALRKYAMLLTDGSGMKKAPSPTGRNHVQDIVKGIIEGETRVIVSGMTMEEIFKERLIFKTKIIENVQSELDQFGLKIYNANVKELQDTHGSEYFKFLSRKAHEGASNQAKVDVANARMIGEIGEAEKVGKTRQEISKIDAQTAVLETQRKSEKAQADAQLLTTQTKLNMGIKLTQIEANRQAEARDAELQKNVEMKRSEMELEKRRATDLVHAKIERESAQQKADARLYSETKTADAKLYSERNTADAKFYTDTKTADGVLYRQKLDAEAAYYRATKDAEAAFFAQQKQAEGISAMAKAYADLSTVMDGPAGLLQYLMLQDNTYEKLARANAEAIRGLQPKITVWNTGANGDANGGGADAGAAVRNIFQSLPPLLSTIQDQTGMRPPTWLARMPEDGMESVGARDREIIPAKGKEKMVNGNR